MEDTGENLNMVRVKWQKWAMKLSIKDQNIIDQEIEQNSIRKTTRSKI